MREIKVYNNPSEQNDELLWDALKRSYPERWKEMLRLTNMAFWRYKALSGNKEIICYHKMQDESEMDFVQRVSTEKEELRILESVRISTSTTENRQQKRTK